MKSTKRKYYRIASKESMSRAGMLRRKAVCCVNTGQKYVSIKAAAEHLGISHASIREVLCGKTESVKGYKFQYI